MRGKAAISSRKFNFTRITPAYAGKRMEKAKEMLRRKDHPRLCGEKFVQLLHVVVRPGSPPPMRGKVTPSFAFCYILGITPAYAGKRKNGTVKGAM